MSSRVEQENAARQAAEAERAQKRAEREGRDHKVTEARRETFARLVKANADGADRTRRSEAHADDARRAPPQSEKTARGVAEADRQARLARGGTLQHARVVEQARTFQGSLERAADETRQADTERVERRDAGLALDRTERDARVEDLDARVAQEEREEEDRRIEAHEAARPNGHIDGERGGEGDGPPDRRGSEAALRPPRAGHAVDGARGSPARQIPTALLEKIASTVHLAVTAKGLREFQIDLKEGVLSGARLRISADGAKVTLRFEGLDGNLRNLIEASKGDLMRRLGAKGLTLSRLEAGP